MPGRISLTQQHWNHFQSSILPSSMESSVTVEVHLVNSLLGLLLDELLEPVQVPGLNRGKQLCLHDQLVVMLSPGHIKENTDNTQRFLGKILANVKSSAAFLLLSNSNTILCVCCTF